MANTYKIAAEVAGNTDSMIKNLLQHCLLGEGVVSAMRGQKKKMAPPLPERSNSESSGPMAVPVKPKSKEQREKVASITSSEVRPRAQRQERHLLIQIHLSVYHRKRLQKRVNGEKSNRLGVTALFHALGFEHH